VSLSGLPWVNRYPTSSSTNSLVGTFQTNAESFISALRAAGATVTISATYRPPERAHLMHYAYRIANEGLAPSAVPAYPGVDIQWVHTDSLGNPDVPASRTAARAMVRGYGIVHRPSLTSRHTEGLAIDMNISWTGTLSIPLGNNQTRQITTTPRSGANTDLHAVGRGFGVIKLVTDPPHWSNDGH
jgi:D-alanyl-D-alanine dipeptidase